MRRKERVCSKCRSPHLAPGQAYCRPCRAEWMKARRADIAANPHLYTHLKKPVIKDREAYNIKAAHKMQIARGVIPKPKCETCNGSDTWLLVIDGKVHAFCTEHHGLERRKIKNQVTEIG